MIILSNMQRIGVKSITEEEEKKKDTWLSIIVKVAVPEAHI